MNGGPEKFTPTRPGLAAGSAFAVSALGAVGFAVGYAMRGGTQVLGAALAVAFGGLAVGLTIWARHMLPPGGYVEEHGSFGSPAVEQERAVAALTGIARPHRRGLIGMLGVALLSLFGALIFPLRSLMQPKGEHPSAQLARTAWRAGNLRLMGTNDEPIRLTDVEAGTIHMVYPEGHRDTGDTPSFVVRLDPDRLLRRPPAGDIDGVVAYSLLCTHAGCPVSLYEQSTGRMLCPCHQSIFDLLDGARAVAGPAGRSLPGLPLGVDADGFLYATGDFTSPPGPGYWGRP